MTTFYAVLFKSFSSANYDLTHTNYFKNEEDAVAYVQRYVNFNHALMMLSDINDMEKTYLKMILKYDVYISAWKILNFLSYHNKIREKEAVFYLPHTSESLTFTFAIQRLSWSEQK